VVPDPALVGAAVAVELRPERLEHRERAVVHLDGQVRLEDSLGVLEPLEDVRRNVDVRRGVVDLLLQGLERVRLL
jgi:hypothetical protein